MKKILNIILCVLVVVSLFTVSVSALDIEMTQAYEQIKPAYFSEDYTVLNFEENVYTVIDSYNISYENPDMYPVTVDLTEQQKQTVSWLELNVVSNGLLIEANYKLSSGIQMTVNYIDNRYLNQYNNALNGKAENVRVNFGYPEDNFYETSLAKLKQNKTELAYDDMNTVFLVCADIDIRPKEVGVVVGRLILYGGVYYYLDYCDAGIKGEAEMSSLLENDKKTYTVYEITDRNTVSELNNCYSLYNSGLGIINDYKITNAFANALAVTVFGVLPLAVLVLSVIFGMRFKEKYRKLFFGLGGISIVEIVVFAIISILLGGK